MSQPTAPEKNDPREGGVEAPSDRGGKSVPFGEVFDFSIFLALAREAGELLGQFSPPDSFKPGQPAVRQPIAPEMIRDLGAGSLDEFYAQSLAPERPEDLTPLGDGRVADKFPRGPESIRPALNALEGEINRLGQSAEVLENSWASQRPEIVAERTPLENRLARYKESRAKLRKVIRLWPRLKGEADKWPEEVKGLWRNLKQLEEVVRALVKGVRDYTGGGEGEGGENHGRRALAQAAVDLKAELVEARKIASARAQWAEKLELFLLDLDQLLAQVMKSSPLDKDRGVSGVKLSERLLALEEEERRLAEESIRSVLVLSNSLGGLTKLEKDYLGPGRELRERLEVTTRACAALWRSTAAGRRDLARIYFVLPSGLGRPVYLDKLFLNLALALGRTQARLEDLRHRLTLAGERLPDTKKLRQEAEGYLSRLSPALPRTGELKTARRRLASLLKAVSQYSPSFIMKSTPEPDPVSEREMNRELNRGLVEIRRMRKELESANSELKLKNQEKARLEEQLTAARQGLGAVSQVKGKLLKAFADKAALLQAAERDRWTKRLTRHRKALRRLVAVREVMRSELDEARLKMAGLENERRFIASQMEETRVRGRETTRQNEELRDQLARLTGERDDLDSRLTDLRRENETLASRNDFLEEDRAHYEERLAAVERDRNDLDEQVTALENQARELTARISEMSSEKERLAALTADLEGQRQDLAGRAESLEKERETLSGQLAEMEARVLNDLAPFIKTLTEALWRSQARLKHSRRSAKALLERVRLEGDVREANLRLAAAAREIELVEAGQAQEKDFTALASAREEELARTGDRLRDAETLNNVLVGERETLTRDNMDLTESVARLSDRSRKLRQALDTLKRRYGRRLEKARQTEDGLRELLRRQKGETAGQVLRLDSLVGHFFEQAAQSFSPEEAGERALAQTLKDDSRVLLAEEGLADDQVVDLGVIGEPLDDSAEPETEASGEPVLDLAAMAGGEVPEAGEEPAAAAGGEDSEADEEPVVDLAVAVDDDDELEAAEEYVGGLAVAADEDEAGSAGEYVVDLAVAGDEDEVAAVVAGDVAPAADLGFALALDSSALKDRLDELQPLVAFLARSYVSGVAELAQARRERTALNEELVRLRRPEPAAEGAGGAELEQLRAQASSLALERDQLKTVLVEKIGEISALKQELAQADRDLAENDGRLEASWAALNYLGTKAGDTLANLKGKLDHQARQVDGLTLELSKREAQVKTLEDRQDKLALLYWTLIARGAGSPALASAAFPRPMAFTSPPAGDDRETEAEPVSAAVDQ